MSLDTARSNTTLWTDSHGRSPSLQLRHTVDDKLMVATHTSFLPLRAMLHRNSDDIVLFSDEVVEAKLKRSREGLSRTSLSRSFVVTNKHVYVMSMPGKEFFAPASSGGCFHLNELSRVCVGKNATVVMQFVNGVIAVESSDSQSAQRIGDVLFSATGITCEKIDDNESKVASVGSVHYSRDTARFAVSSVQSFTPTNHTTKSRVSVGMGSEMSSGGVENVLRDILKSTHETENFAAFHEIGVQTVEQTGNDKGVGTDHLGCDRSTSPISFFEKNTQLPQDARSESEQSGSTANTDFETADVWRSLRRTPPIPYSKVEVQRSSGSHSPVSFRPKPTTPPSKSEERRKDLPLSTKLIDEPLAQESASIHLEQFLGVLSVYIPGLSRNGIDSVAKLVSLTEGDVDKLLTDSGVHKQGHRLLLHSKISLHRSRVR